jgi:hypothetical protein
MMVRVVTEDQNRSLRKPTLSNQLAAIAGCLVATLLRVPSGMVLIR